MLTKVVSAKADTRLASAWNDVEKDRPELRGEYAKILKQLGSVKVYAKEKESRVRAIEKELRILKESQLQALEEKVSMLRED